MFIPMFFEMIRYAIVNQLLPRAFYLLWHILGICLSLGRTSQGKRYTIFYTNGYESILTENWRSRAVSNKDLLGGRQFLGINNEDKKKRCLWSLQPHHRYKYEICRAEEEYDLFYLPRLPLINLMGTKDLRNW